MKRGLSTKDQELVDRLSKLRNATREMRNIPSQDEIETRLAKLKGIDPDVYKKPIVFSQPKKSNVDSVTDLLNQMVEENEIDLQSGVHPASVIPAEQVVTCL